MRLRSRNCVVDPRAQDFHSLRSQIDLEDPGENEVVVYESDPHAGFVFKRSVLHWSRDPDIPAPPGASDFVYANATPLRAVTGFGTSLTDAAVMQLDKMTPEQSDALLAFHCGLCKMHMIRVPMGSCDFGTRSYSFVDREANLAVQPEDTKRERWLAKIRDSWPLRVLLAPWSAPPWMKTSHSFVGGELKPEYFATWAQCLVAYAQRYEELGFPVLALSVQNEPRQLPALVRQFWETMFFEPDSLAKLSSLVARQPGSPLLLLADDQKVLLERLAGPTLERVPLERIWGAGVHSYQWPGQALDEAKSLYGKPVIVSEFCTGFSSFLSHPRGRDKGTRHAAQYARDLIGSLRNGNISGYVDWNLVLDEAGGPTWCNNNVDSLSWLGDDGRLYVSYMGWLFAHVAAFSGTHICDSATVGVTAGHVPLAICFSDRRLLYLTVFNDAWFGTQTFHVVARGRWMVDSLGHRCCKTYVFRR